MERNQALATIRAAMLQAAALSVLRGALADRVGKLFFRTLEATEDALAAGGRPAAMAALDSYGELFAALADQAQRVVPAAAAVCADLWQSHLARRIVADDNAFARAAEHGGSAAVPAYLRDATAHDLRRLRRLYQIDATTLRGALGLIVPEAGELPLWVCQAAGDAAAPSVDEALSAFAARLAAASDWAALVDDLAEAIAARGAGVFGEHRALRWVRRGLSGRLEGIDRPDPIRLTQLIGYEDERAQVVANTERFLAGLPACNVLLYGDRGTGKSSTVKALLHAYAPRGLRLIEMSKRHLLDFPRLACALRDRPQRFIVFVDDLSFEEHEIAYKELKAILEGGVEPRPPNVLIYATSNRRHLVKERFSDRQVEVEPAGDAEVRRQDTLQEKLSLADRFGLTVIFPTPDQEQYLAIVEGLARERGVAMPREELRRLALRWEMYHNGRSGRTARQFVESLVGRTVG